MSSARAAGACCCFTPVTQTLFVIQDVRRGNGIDLNGSWQSAAGWGCIMSPPGKWNASPVEIAVVIV